MTIEFYAHIMSPPCRTVLLAAKALNVELTFKEIDMSKGDNLKPEFVKLNPQHAIPTLVDDGFAISESRAIITYLANQYGKGSPLYPADPKARALVDQRLHFDGNTLYARFADYAFPYWFAGAPTEEAKLTKALEAVGFLETFLQGSKFVAGSTLTLADLSIVVSITTFQKLIDFAKYPKITAWLETVKTSAPGYKEANEKGLQDFLNYITNVLKK